MISMSCHLLSLPARHSGLSQLRSYNISAYSLFYKNRKYRQKQSKNNARLIINGTICTKFKRTSSFTMLFAGGLFQRARQKWKWYLCVRAYRGLGVGHLFVRTRIFRFFFFAHIFQLPQHIDTLSNWPHRYRLGEKIWVPRCIMKRRGASAISHTDHSTLSLILKHPRWKVWEFVLAWRKIDRGASLKNIQCTLVLARKKLSEVPRWKIFNVPWSSLGKNWARCLAEK